MYPLQSPDPLGPDKENPEPELLPGKTNCSSISPLSLARQLDSRHFHYFQFFDTIQEIELSPTPELDLKPPGVLQNLMSFSI